MAKKIKSLNELYTLVVTAKKMSVPVTMAFALVVLSVVTAVYHLHTAYFGQPTAIVYRTISINLFLIAGFLFFPVCKGKLVTQKFQWFHILDFISVAFIIWVQLYILVDVDGFMERRGDPSFMDVIIGTGYILLVFELTRRAVGFSLVLMVLFFFFHSFLADHFIGVFYGPPVPYSSLIDLLFLSEDGLFGIPVMAFADFIFLFILFGVFLFNAGAGDYFMDVAFALTRKQVGGPAKASVLSSALMATVSGSAGGNVAITGQFSIPLMKKAGFSSTTAGAIEAVASTGGQIMPPVMGAAAFIMAYYLGVPYIKICLAALFPAALYFFSVYLMVHFEAQKKGLQLSGEDHAAISMNILIKRAYFLLPLGVIIGMLIAGFTATMAGFYGIISTFLISLVNKDTRIGPDTMISIFTDTLKFCIPIAAACACVGVVIGSIYISGLGLKMGGMILSLGNNNMLLTLIFTMIVSIILGMGLPTAIVYLTLAAMVIPGLVDLGVNEMAAHMFCFYFGVVSCITPPVAISSFVAAGISGANFLKTGLISMKIGLAAYIIPFLFVNNPEILLQGEITGSLIFKLIVCLAGIFSLAVFIQGYFRKHLKLWERLFFGIATALILVGGNNFEIYGTILLIIAIAMIWAKTRKKDSHPYNGEQNHVENYE